MKCLGKAHEDLLAKDIELVAVSVDPVATQTRFVSSLALPFRLLADTDRAVAKAYGVHVVSPSGGHAARSVFLIDKEGKIRHADRDFGVVDNLAGTTLQAAIDALVGKEPDPVDGLKDEPSPQREGKILAARLVQAVLAEDIKELSRLLHPDYGARPGKTTAKQREVRKATLDRYRKLFRENDLHHQIAFDEVLDLRRVKVKSGEEAATHARSTMTKDHRPLSALWKDGDLLVQGKTKPAKVGGKRLFAAEWILLARKRGEAYLLVAEGTR